MARLCPKTASGWLVAEHGEAPDHSISWGIAALCPSHPSTVVRFRTKPSSLESLIKQLVLIALEPASVELSLQAAESVESERERLEKHHLQPVQRTEYEAGLARTDTL